MDDLRLRYQTLEFGDVDVHVRALRDLQEFRNDGGEAESYGISSATWPRFGVVWAAGHMLARVMLDEDVAGRRVLEVGCGIALASLLLRERGEDVTATDRHPEAGRFLTKNIALNGGREIPFFRECWDPGGGTPHDGEGERFGLIMASDVLYERDHAALLSAFINRHAEPKCEVIIVDPGRGELARFKDCMSALGFESREFPLPEPVPNQAAFKGRLVRLERLQAA